MCPNLKNSRVCRVEGNEFSIVWQKVGRRKSYNEGKMVVDSSRIERQNEGWITDGSWKDLSFEKARWKLVANIM